jgi:hypothetical protein
MFSEVVGQFYRTGEATRERHALTVHPNTLRSIRVCAISWAWMKPADHAGHSVPIQIPKEIMAKCDGPDQFDRFDRAIRAFLTVPKSAVLKDEAKTKRRKKRTNKPA